MMKTFDDASKYGKEMMDNNLKSFAAVTKGFQTIASEAADYSRGSFEKGTSAFEKLIAAKTLENAVEIQADFMKSSYEAFVTQSTKISDLVADMAKEAYKPFENAVSKAK